MTEAQLIERGFRAKALIDNPLYAESFALVRQAYLDAIEKCSLTDVETVENLRKCLKLLRDVRAQVDQAVSSGKVELFRREQAEKRKNPLFGLFK